jgi:acetolactate synthase-1/2/3 large subunit
MVRPVTKYASQVREPTTIRAELDRAFRCARSGRPGPVWLDIPLDVQASTLDETLLIGEPEEPAPLPSQKLTRDVDQTLKLLRDARRPVLILGNGIWLSGAAPLIGPLLRRLQVPVLLPIAAMDLVPERHPCHLGAFGPFGRRASNFALQNSDLLVSIGAGLSLASVGFQTQTFAPKARKILVNIDSGELTKPVLKADVAILADANDFLQELLRQLGEQSLRAPARWQERCQRWKADYPPGPRSQDLSAGFVNSYKLVEELSDLLRPGDVIVTGNSLDACSVYQSFRVQERQRILINANCGPMGWDLPGALGAAVAHAPDRVVLIAGDGSIQFNIQELQTIRKNSLDIKIFLLNNDGYESIRSTQRNYFEGRFVGSSTDSGIGNPDFAKLCEAFGIAYDRLERPRDTREVCSRVLASVGPTLCEVMISPIQTRTPRTSSFRRDDGSMESRPIEDMAPFLPPEEVSRNMHFFDDDQE